MALRVLKFIAEQEKNIEAQKPIIIGKIINEREKWNKGYSAEHDNVPHLLDELKEQGLIVFPTSEEGVVELTKRGRKVSVILSEEPKKSKAEEHEKAIERVVEYCKKTPEVLYRPRHFIKALGLDVNPRGFAISLSLKFQKFGLLKVDDEKLNAYFGFSEVCGSRYCFESWCSDKYFCKTKNGNEKLKFYEKEN